MVVSEVSYSYFFVNLISYLEKFDLFDLKLTLKFNKIKFFSDQLHLKRSLEKIKDFTLEIISSYNLIM